MYNRTILSPEFERSGYNSIWTDEETDEWLQTVEDGIVVSCCKTEERVAGSCTASPDGAKKTENG